MKVFNLDNPVYNFLSRAADIFILNLLWVICSMPIITMGASTTALYYSMLKIHRAEETGIIRMFFQSFKRNLKQGCILTVILGLSGLSVLIDLQLNIAMSEGTNTLAVVLFVVLVTIWGIVCSYAFPLLAQFDNSVINTLKNALFMGIFNFGKTIPILLLNSIPYVLFFLVPSVFQYCLPLLVTLGIALIARINTIFLAKIFDTYIKKNNVEDSNLG